MASWQHSQAEGRRFVCHAPPHPTHHVIAPHVPILHFYSSQRTVICYSDQKQRLYASDKFLGPTDMGFTVENRGYRSTVDEDFSFTEDDAMKIFTH